MHNDIKEKIKLIPEKPGCYLMKDHFNEIIYVGKAKNLKRRVSSYFVGAHNAKTTLLVSEIVDFEYIVTSSELESLILEIIRISMMIIFIIFRRLRREKKGNYSIMNCLELKDSLVRCFKNMIIIKYFIEIKFELKR